MAGYYARVMTETGDVIHLAEVALRNQPFDLEGLKTLCGFDVARSLEGTVDVCDCMTCLAKERARPLPRRSEERPMDPPYIPSHRRKPMAKKRDQALEEVLRAVDSVTAPEKMSKREEKDFLESLASDIEGRLDAVTNELKEQEDG